MGLSLDQGLGCWGDWDQRQYNGLLLWVCTWLFTSHHLLPWPLPCLWGVLPWRQVILLTLHVKLLSVRVSHTSMRQETVNLVHSFTKVTDTKDLRSYVQSYVISVNND